MSELRLLLTRPETQSRRFADACRTRFGDAFDVVIAPIMEIVPLYGQVDLTGLTGLVFTSENGVAALAAVTARRDLSAWCVGPRTAAAARERGFDAQAAGGDVAGLVAALVARGLAGPLLHVHGRHVAGQAADALSKAGIVTRSVALYDQRARVLTPAGRAALAAPGPLVVPVFSPRSAELLAPALREAVAELRVAVISGAAAAPLSGIEPARLKVAARPDAAAMLDAVGLLIGW